MRQLSHHCEIYENMHRNMLPLLEFKEEEIYAVCYECESLVSSNESLGDVYRVGQEKIQEFLKNMEIKKMLKDTLTDDDQKQIQNNSNHNNIFLCNRLHYDESQNVQIKSDFDERKFS